MIHLFRMGWIGVGGGATHTPNLRQRFRFEANALTVSNFRRAYLSLSLSLSYDFSATPLVRNLASFDRDRHDEFRGALEKATNDAGRDTGEHRG